MVVVCDQKFSAAASVSALDAARFDDRAVCVVSNMHNHAHVCDIVLGIAYGRNLSDRFSVGATGKYISQRIHHSSASSFALDLGIYYQTRSDKIRIGMSISNFGSDMTLDGKDLYKKIDLDPDHSGHNEALVAKLKTDPWPLPLFFRVGTAVNIFDRNNIHITVSTDAFIPSDDVEMINLGVESVFSNRTRVQLGYKGLGNKYSEEGFTFGAGTQFYTKSKQT